MWLKKPNCTRCNKAIEKEQEYAVVHCKDGKKITIHFSCLYESVTSKVVPMALDSFSKDFLKGLDNIKKIMMQMPFKKDLEELKP